MLSRRDKLLVQPWEERRFKDHRSKVAAALPAIDSAAPASRAHVAVKLKKWQRERERAARVRRDNCALLQRLAALMRTHRLDNRWQSRLPPHTFQNKVGRFYEARELEARVAQRAAPPPPPRDARLKCYACDHNKMRHYAAPEPREAGAPPARRALPFINYN